MTHLTPEELARLVDEAMTARDIAHLSKCPSCLATLEEMRAQTLALSTLPELTPSPQAWTSIEQRVSASIGVRVRRAWVPEQRRRVTAAAVWMMIGAGIQAALVALMFASPNKPAVTGSLVNGGAEVGALRARPASDSIASNQPRSVDEVVQQFNAVSEQYRALLSEYASISNIEPTGDPSAQMAVLQAIVLTTKAALDRSPADPIINSYYLNARAELDALNRQYGGAAGDQRQ
jgi:hypothetical protein